VDNGIPTQEPLRSYQIEEAGESIRREVERLLNTRCTLPAECAGETTVLQYGVPDFTHISAASTLDLLALSRKLSWAITSFEPRLSHVQVELRRDPSKPNAAVGHLHAKLQLRTMSEAVSFPLALGRDGQASVAEPEEVP
jgi:type VI secretion system lysozyme-like protein